MYLKILVCKVNTHYLYVQDQGASVQKTVWTVKRCICMVVYFHFYWWWWAVVDCTVLYWAVLSCTGLCWSVLGCSGLYWAVLGYYMLHGENTWVRCAFGIFFLQFCKNSVWHHHRSSSIFFPIMIINPKFPPTARRDCLPSPRGGEGWCRGEISKFPSLTFWN